MDDFELLYKTKQFCSLTFCVFIDVITLFAFGVSWLVKLNKIILFFLSCDIWLKCRLVKEASFRFESASMILLILLSISVNVVIGYQCTNGDPMTCSLGGKCIDNECKCDPAFKGENCETLDLLPTDQYQAYYRPYASSWGGSVIYSKTDSLYHMFSSDIAYNCSLHDYSQNSRVIHVTSPNPQGPYTNTAAGDDITVPIFSHEPTVHYIPNDDVYIIYHIGWGNRTGGWSNCSNETSIDYKVASNLGGVDNNTFPNRAIASDLNGKWINYPSSRGEEEWQCPQAYVYPNGSILYITCRTGCTNATIGPYCFGVSFAESYDQPLQWIGSTNLVGEDGYFWRDVNGYFHMIYHVIQGPRIGAHGFSKDGIDWHLATTNVTAFPYYYTTTNGTQINVKRREITQILLNENGLPAYMFNAVQEGNEYWTGVQPINTSYS